MKCYCQLIFCCLSLTPVNRPCWGVQVRAVVSMAVQASSPVEEVNEAVIKMIANHLSNGLKISREEHRYFGVSSNPIGCLARLILFFHRKFRIYLGNFPIISTLPSCHFPTDCLRKCFIESQPLIYHISSKYRNFNITYSILAERKNFCMKKIRVGKRFSI